MFLKPTITSFSPTIADSGATVTITGTDLTGATAVSFDGIPAKSFTVTNATTISAVVGTGATGDVSVTTPGGTATLAGFTLMAPAIDGYNSSDEIESASLIAHWPFDGTTETVNNANPVLMGGTQTYVSGRIGQALHLVMQAGLLMALKQQLRVKIIPHTAVMIPCKTGLL